MDYDDFVIRIGPDDGRGHRLDVTGPSGERGSGFLDLSSIPDDELARLATSEKAWMPPRPGAPEPAAVPSFPPRDLGRRLFDALLPGDLRALWERGRGQAEARGRGLRIRLRIPRIDDDTPGPEVLFSLPWELLRPENGEFLALSRETPVVRDLEVSQPAGDRPGLERLRVLAVTAEPADQRPLGLHEEWDALVAVWHDHPAVELVPLRNPTLDQLRDAVDGFHVLHFMGHGGFDADENEWIVCLVDEEGDSDPVSATLLAGELADFRRPLRLVVLNSCQTARYLGPGPGGESPAAGVAVAMVGAGLTGVVAMQAIISDRAALEFSKGFYHRLAAGDPVERAVAAARRRIYGHERTKAVWPAEWATPVIFLRAEHGEIFEAPDDPGRQAEPDSWGPSGLGLAGLASGGLGTSLLAGLASLWALEPPLRSGLTVVLVALGGLGWLSKELWALYRSKKLTHRFSRAVAERRGLLAAFFALPLVAIGGWVGVGTARVEQLRCRPLASPAWSFAETPRRVVVEPWTTPDGASREEILWALETTEHWRDTLRRVETLQVLEQRPAKLPASCVDVTISGQIRRDANQDVVLRATLSDPSQQGTSFERIDRPDDFGAVDHLRAGLMNEVLAALDVESMPEPVSSPDVRLLNRRGVLALLEGDTDEAERRLLGALELDPDDATVHNNLGRVLLRSEPPRPEAAIAHFRRAAELAPERVLYVYNLALALERQATWRRAEGAEPGRYRPLLEEAARVYGEALELDRNHARASNNLGFTLIELGDLRPAREALERAYRLAGEGLVPFVEKNLGRLALSEGRPRDALEHLEAALERDPGLTRESRAEAVYFLAAARDALANGTESIAACGAWREYLEIAGDDPEPQRRRDAVERESAACGED